MKTITINIKTHLGNWQEKECDIRVWEAFHNSTKRTSPDSEWYDNKGNGSVTLAELQDSQNAEPKE